MFYFTKIDSLKEEYENALLRTQLELQENAIQKISREIHDNIGLSLTLAKLNLNIFSTQDARTDFSKIDTSINLLSKAITDIRNISKSLNSDRIITYGLVKSLEEEIDTLKKMNVIDIHFKINGKPVFLDNNKELLVFRIIQECINNIIKHSKAKLAFIELSYRQDSFSLQIADNGIGFQPTNGEFRKGSGLFNIMARTKIMNGKCVIDSSKNGTSIIISIPF